MLRPAQCNPADSADRGPASRSASVHALAGLVQAEQSVFLAGRQLERPPVAALVTGMEIGARCRRRARTETRRRPAPSSPRARTRPGRYGWARPQQARRPHAIPGTPGPADISGRPTPGATHRWRPSGARRTRPGTARRRRLLDAEGRRRAILEGDLEAARLDELWRVRAGLHAHALQPTACVSPSGYRDQRYASRSACPSPRRFRPARRRPLP